MASDDKPLYVQERKGRWFWEPPARLRRSHGAKSRALGAETVTAWALARKLNSELETLRAGEGSPGTVAWVFNQFFETEKFKALARSTQLDYRWLGKRLGAVKFGAYAFGQLNAKAVRPRHADFVHGLIETESGHATAHYAVRFARRVWKWAARKEFVDLGNPWSGMELKGIPEREQVWTPEQVASLISSANEHGKPSIGLAAHIAYSFAHRKGDILTLTWTDLDNEMRRTSKTQVKLPMVQASYPDLADAIAVERARQKASPKPSTHVIVCEMTGRPWHPDVFSHHFRMIADLAEIPSELQFRDFRATALTEMKDGGADIIDMSTHSGHKTAAMARRYARPTGEQFQRAAAKRNAHKNKRITVDGTADGTPEHKSKKGP